MVRKRPAHKAAGLEIQSDASVLHLHGAQGDSTTRFPLSVLQSKPILGLLIIRTLLLLLELTSYKKCTSSYCLIKRQTNRKVNHRRAVVLF